MPLARAGSTPRVDTDLTSAPLEALRIDRAQQLLTDEGREPGPGSRSPCSTPASPTARSSTSRPGSRSAPPPRELAYDHGTAVAGLIAGHQRGNGKAVGVAPGAEIVDVRVYDADPPEPTADPPEAGVTTQALVHGLDWVASHAKSTAHQGRQRLARGRAEHDAGGGRGAGLARRRGGRGRVGQPAGRGALNFERFGTYRHGEDARDEVFPAGYPHVVAVNATAGGPGDVDLLGVGAPEHGHRRRGPDVGAVSLALNGSTCVLQDVATSWAAAEVSGVVALLWSRYPDDTAARSWRGC